MVHSEILKPHSEFSLQNTIYGYRYFLWEIENGPRVRFTLRYSKDTVIEVELEQKRWDLQVIMRTSGKLDEKMIDWSKDRVRFCFGIDEDLSQFKLVAKQDPHLREAIEKLPGYRLKATPSVYEMLVACIISQNCTRDAFFQGLKELVESIGRKELIDKREVFGFPLPEEMRSAKLESFKPRLRYRMKGIQQVLQGLGDDYSTDHTAHMGFFEWERIRNLPPERSVEELKKLRGVGDYTAWAIQLYGLRRHSVVFVDGYVQKLLGKLYFSGRKPSFGDIRRFAQQEWGEWQGYCLDFLLAYSQIG